MWDHRPDRLLQNICSLPRFTPVDQDGRSTSHFPKIRRLNPCFMIRFSSYFMTRCPIFILVLELVVQFPARGSTQVLLCLFPGVLWLWHFLYSVGPHLVTSLHIYTFVVLRTFMAGAASQAGDADPSRAPGLTSGLQGSVNVHRGATVTVHHLFCILHWNNFRIEVLY